MILGGLKQFFFFGLGPWWNTIQYVGYNHCLEIRFCCCQWWRVREPAGTNTQHIRMISEGSCDTEDWSNDAENSQE